jgi:hypothetical protein
LSAHQTEVYALGALLVGISLPCLLHSQTPAHLTVPLGNGSAQITEPAVPPDRFELVTGDAQLIEDPQQRAEMVMLVTKALRHSNVRVQPYDLKTSFSAMGTGGSDGVWELQDTSLGSRGYRWTAQGPGYSAVHLFLNKVLYSNRPSDTLPIRLAQVRSAMFFIQPNLGPRATIRYAAASLDNSELTCVLVAHNMVRKAVSGGRSWDEAEYCIDGKSHTVATYSPIPGLYVHYDYANATQFHNTLVPGKFSISQAGQIVVDAKTVSVADPSDESGFQPSGLNTIGMGPAMSPPWHYHANTPAPSGMQTDQMQVVIVHGIQSPKGRLSDVELIASSNPSLNNSALQYASKWKAGPMAAVVEPGTTPQSHEVFLTVQYVSAQSNRQTVSSGQ